MSKSTSKWRMYSDFYELFVKANPKLLKEKAQVEANIVWSSLKVGKNIDIDLYHREMTRLRALVKKNQTMLDFLLKPKTQKSLPASTSKGDSSEIVTGAASNIESNNVAKLVKETSTVVLSEVFSDPKTVEEKAPEGDSNNLHDKSDS